MLRYKTGRRITHHCKRSVHGFATAVRVCVTQMEIAAIKLIRWNGSGMRINAVPLRIRLQIQNTHGVPRLKFICRRI